MAGGKSKIHTLLLAGAMIGFTLFASLTNIVAKDVLTRHSPYLVAFLRFLLAPLALWIGLRLLRRRIYLHPLDRWRFVVLAILVVPLNQLLFLVGLRLTPANHPGLLYATTPVWVLLITVALGIEKVRGWKVAGLVLSFLGVLIFLAGEGVRFSSAALQGDLILLLAVLSWALYTALGKPLVERYGPLETTFITLSFGALLYLPFGLPVAIRTGVAAFSMHDWAAILFLGVVTSGLVYFLWYWLLNYLRASQVALLTCSIAPTTALLAWLILGEAVTSYLAIGGGLALAGIAIVMLAGGEKRFLKPISVPPSQSPAKP